MLDPDDLLLDNATNFFKPAPKTKGIFGAMSEKIGSFFKKKKQPQPKTLTL